MKKLAPADDAAAAAKMEMSFMTPGISLSKGRRASPKRRMWRAAYHAAGRLAKRCASP
jgi:hypothetical protein